MRFYFLLSMLIISVSAQAKDYGDFSTAQLEVKTLTEAVEGHANQTDTLQMIKGRVAKVCQKKGCWMVLSDGEVTARVMTGHRYFLPKKANGDAIVYGTLAQKKLSKSKAQHYAEESGMHVESSSQTDVQEWQIDASGIRLQD